MLPKLLLLKKLMLPEVENKNIYTIYIYLDLFMKIIMKTCRVKQQTFLMSW